MFKVVKVYLKNSLELQCQEIYCLRLNFNDQLDGLKNKIFARYIFAIFASISPCLTVFFSSDVRNLRIRMPKYTGLVSHNDDSSYLWFREVFSLSIADLENDKIRITCDDDLKFFIEESPCHKIIFNFGHGSDLVSSRKRTSAEIADDVETSKRIRKQFQQIDLSSESSAMETDDDDVTSVSSADSSAKDSAQVLNDELIPSTSAAALCITPESPNVQVLSIEIIKPAEEPAETIERNDEHGNEVHIIADDPVIVEAAKSDDKVQQSGQKDSLKKKPDTNRIVISDSSDEETTREETNNNRRHSDGPSASAYSFANVNGAGFFESRSSFSGGRHQNSHRFRGHRGHHGHHYHSFREQTREFQRCYAENMDRIQEHARMTRDHAGRMARDHAARAVRASTSVIPDLVSTFQYHFRRPMFRIADINQNIFGGR